MPHPVLLLRNKRLLDRDLTNLSAVRFVDPDPHLNTAQRRRVRGRCLALEDIVNTVLAVVIKTVRALVSAVLSVLVEAVVFVVE